MLIILHYPDAILMRRCNVKSNAYRDIDGQRAFKAVAMALGKEKGWKKNGKQQQSKAKAPLHLLIYPTSLLGKVIQPNETYTLKFLKTK
jgi:hypothetical protein